MIERAVPAAILSGQARRRAPRACRHLSRSSVAGRQGTPMEEGAVFSYRVARARRAFILARSRSTLLRLLEVQSGQATGASWRCGGIAGRASMSRMCSRKRWLVWPRSPTTHFGTPDNRSRRGMAWGQVVRLTRRDAEGNGPTGTIGDHASLGAISAARSAKRRTIVSRGLRSPFPNRTGRLLTSPDAGAVEEHHPEPARRVPAQGSADAPRRRRAPEPDEHLSRSPPWSRFHRDPRATSPRSDAATGSRISCVAAPYGGVLPLDRQASTSGFKIVHCASVSIAPPG